MSELRCAHCRRVAEMHAHPGMTARELAAVVGMAHSNNAYSFARAHGYVLARTPRPPRAPRPPRPPRTPSGAKIKLIALLKERPNICETMTLTDIGNEIGVTRERVRQIMPEYAKRRRAVERVARFVEEHPEVTIPTWMGGMSYPQAAALLGVSNVAVSKAMRELGYKKRQIRQTPQERAKVIADAQRRRLSDPEKRAAHNARTIAWQRAHPEQTKAMRHRSAQKWGRTVLRRETCIVCGTEFDWTRWREMNSKGKPVTCSKSCGQRARWVLWKSEAR